MANSWILLKRERLVQWRKTQYKSLNSENNLEVFITIAIKAANRELSANAPVRAASGDVEHIDSPPAA